MAVLEQTRIHISQDTLDRIARRVADAEIGYAPDDDANWSYGVDAAYLAELRDYWRDRYDWRAAEAAFNAHPQFQCEIEGVPIHFFRFRPPGGEGAPLVLTHGWPGSPVEFMDAGPRLAAQGFDVIVPSLPGYAFSGRPARPINAGDVARMWRKLMVEGLGFSKFNAQGGDWGAFVTLSLGREHPEVLNAIHVNMMILPFDAEQTPEMLEWRQRVQAVIQQGGAYSMIHATRPQTIGLALADTPVGFAGWVVEKCREWSDCSGDVESVFSKDALITNVMTYLATGRVQSAIWIYRGAFGGAGAGRGPTPPITVPTGFADFPGEFIPPPPRAAADAHVRIARWTRMEKGGHFAAWEQPQLFAAEVGSYFAEFG